MTALSISVHCRANLRQLGLDQDKARVWPLNIVPDRRSIRGVVLAAHPIRCYEFSRHNFDGVAEPRKLTRPLVGTRTGFQGNGAGRQLGEYFYELFDERTMAPRPSSPTPRRANTFLARSIPTSTMGMVISRPSVAG